MRINDYGENFIIKKLQKKVKVNIHTDSLCTISQFDKGWLQGMLWVELPMCRKVFYCDRYQIKGKTMIASAIEDNYISIINMETGTITKAQRVEFEADLTIVTLQGGQRRFIDAEGNIGEAEIGAGGIFYQNFAKYGSVFVDENGNTAGINQTFVDYEGRVRSGIPTQTKGIYQAVNVYDDRGVIYSFTGKEIKNPEEFATYARLYSFYQKELKLASIPDEDLMNKDVYNFILEEIRKRYYKLAEEADKGAYFECTTFADKLDKAIKDLASRREAAINKAIDQEQELLTV